MTKLVYLAAMALLGLGLTMAQSGTPASDPSNSSQPNHAQSDKSTSHSGKPSGHKRQPQDQSQESRPEQKLPDPTVQDQPSGANPTTGASGQNNSTPSNSTMGTTGSNPEPEKTRPANTTGDQPSGDSTDQQPNTSSPPSPHNMAMNTTPAARAMATHSPDPGTCMNPAALDSASSAQQHNPNCD